MQPWRMFMHALMASQWMPLRFVCRLAAMTHCSMISPPSLLPSLPPSLHPSLTRTCCSVCATARQRVAALRAVIAQSSSLAGPTTTVCGGGCGSCGPTATQVETHIIRMCAGMRACMLVGSGWAGCREGRGRDDVQGPNMHARSGWARGALRDIAIMHRTCPRVSLNYVSFTIRFRLCRQHLACTPPAQQQWSEGKRLAI